MSIDLDKLEALARKATPGPWTYTGNEFSPIESRNGSRYPTDIVRAIDGHVYSEYSADSASVEIGTEDGQFIAAANPAAILALIAEVRGGAMWMQNAETFRKRAEAAEAEVRRLREALRLMVRHFAIYTTTGELAEFIDPQQQAAIRKARAALRQEGG